MGGESHKIKFFPYLGAEMIISFGENAHMFENKIHNLESGIFGITHDVCGPSANLNGKICAAIPGIYLAHAGEK